MFYKVERTTENNVFQPTSPLHRLLLTSGLPLGVRVFGNWGRILYFIVNESNCYETGAL